MWHMQQHVPEMQTNEFNWQLRQMSFKRMEACIFRQMQHPTMFLEYTNSIRPLFAEVCQNTRWNLKNHMSLKSF